MLTAKKAPDIFMTGNDMLLDNASKGLLYDWTPMAEQDKEFMDGFYKGVVDSWQFDGKLVGLPGLLNTYGIFYNKKSVQGRGPDGAENRLDVRRIFRGHGEALEQGRRRGSVRLLRSARSVLRLFVFGIRRRAPFADAIISPSKVEISDKFVEGVEKYKNAIASGHMNPPTFDLTNVMSSFKQGKVPMTLQGQWVADDLIRTAPKDLEWGFVPMPVVNGQTEIYDAVGWCSLTTIEHPEAVWKVLKYLDSKMYEEVLPKTPVAPAAYQASSAAYFDALKAAGHPEVGEGIDHILEIPEHAAGPFPGDLDGESESVHRSLLEKRPDGQSADHRAEHDGGQNQQSDFRSKVSALALSAWSRSGSNLGRRSASSFRKYPQHNQGGNWRCHGTNTAHASFLPLRSRRCSRSGRCPKREGRRPTLFVGKRRRRGHQGV
ncbi:extracellular solute-binding protein [Paenibacillus sp. JTLBN-2024]